MSISQTVMQEMLFYIFSCDGFCNAYFILYRATIEGAWRSFIEYRGQNETENTKHNKM